MGKGSQQNTCSEDNSITVRTAEDVLVSSVTKMSNITGHQGSVHKGPGVTAVGENAELWGASTAGVDMEGDNSSWSSKVSHTWMWYIAPQGVHRQLLTDVCTSSTVVLFTRAGRSTHPPVSCRPGSRSEGMRHTESTGWPIVIGHPGMCTLVTVTTADAALPWIVGSRDMGQGLTGTVSVWDLRVCICHAC